MWGDAKVKPCSFPCCERPRMWRTVESCRFHLRKQRARTAGRKNKRLRYPSFCHAPSCQRLAVRGRPFCATHLAQLSRRGYLSPIERQRLVVDTPYGKRSKCRHAGCLRPRDGALGYCLLHKRRFAKGTDLNAPPRKYRRLITDRLSHEERRGSLEYSRLRASQLRRTPYCEFCGKRSGRLDVDHKVRIADGGGMFDLGNLQTLCGGKGSCHLAKTSAENSFGCSVRRVGGTLTFEPLCLRG